MDNTITKQLQYNSLRKESGQTWLLFLLLGWSYGNFGQMGKQIFFYLTLGGIGLWYLYVLFTLNGKIKNYNRDIAKHVGMTTEEMSINKLI